MNSYTELVKMNVLLIDGSPANPSRVAKLLETVADGFKQNNCHIVTLSLHTLQLPINDPAFHLNPQEHPNESVRKLVTAVQAADIIVLGTPLYHGSYSGLLKMALDHLRDDAFGEKAVGLVSNADGPRNALQAAQELVLVARTMKGEVASCVIGTCHADYGMQNGSFQIIGPAILERITKFVDELTSRVR